MTENPNRSYFSPFQINMQLYFLFLFQNGRRPPLGKSDLGHFGLKWKSETIGFFHYVLSMAMPNMKLISEFMTQLETPQAF